MKFVPRKAVRANVWAIVYTYIVNNDSWQAAKQLD